MESTKQNKKSFMKLRSYEQNQVMSFLSLEDFTEKELISKKFREYFLKNHRKIILHYIRFSSKKKLGYQKEFLTKNPFSKFHKKFLKSIFLETNCNIKEEKEEALNNDHSKEDLDFEPEISMNSNFKIFLENFLMKRFLTFAAYKNEGGFYYEMLK